jgi:alcohol dehydrogenase class IV
MSTPRGNFNYPTPYRIGCGRLAELADACRELSIARPLVVTDPGIHGLPWFAEMTKALAGSGLEATVFDGVQGNPVEQNVVDGVEAYRAHGADGCVLVGGGSALDVGKCIALMSGNEGSVFDYEDVGDNWTRVDPAGVAKKIAIPTTAGTGSEVGRASVIVDLRDHNKKIIFHPKMLPELVIADPELTLGLPRSITAATGMDALAHCFEALCAPAYHPMADGIALEGMRLIQTALPRVVEDGSDAEARTHMMMAASMGATAFQKGLGVVHALSHPLGGATGLHHGLANAIFLPYCMAFNRAEIEEKMQVLARHLQLPTAGYPGVMQWMLDLRAQLEIPHTLEGVEGFDEAMAKQLAPLAAADPSMGTNPRPATVAELEQLFLDSWRGVLPT